MHDAINQKSRSLDGKTINKIKKEKGEREKKKGKSMSGGNVLDVKFLFVIITIE